jgi:hypothetical protein
VTLRLSVLVLVTAALTVFWVAECSGPRPVVGDVRLLAPTVDGGPYRVEASVTNAGRGHGEVAVTVKIQDQASGRTVQTDRKLDLDAHESTRILADIPAPPATYVPTVEAVYPPR